MPRQKPTDQYTQHNKVRIVRGGADYFRCIEEIADSARYVLHLQTYIYDADETGQKVGDALIRAARRGVKVYVLLDGYASQKLPSAFISQLRDAGIQFNFFNPFFKANTYYIGRRLHHKVMVADARICIISGINISNRYNDIGGVKAWLDWAVYAEGEAAGQLNEICTRVWNWSRGRQNCQIPPPVSNLPAETCAVRIRRNDWVFTYTEITKSYREMFRDAKKEVILMTSYFWPPQKLLSRMKAAAERGVIVKVILTAKADVPLSKKAERYLYNSLFRSKIEVYEYKPNILHGKLAVCDETWLTAGSYNVNNISAYASVELNFDVRNTPIATQVQETLRSIIANDCVQITLQDFTTRNNVLSRISNYIAYRLIHLIFYLFTFYFIQRRDKA